MRQQLARVLRGVANRIHKPTENLSIEIPEIRPVDTAMLARVRDLSMTEQVAQWNFIQSIRHVERAGIDGAIVECGVWRGGNVVLAGLLREELGFDRDIWAFDTFAGMTAPTEFDSKAKKNLDVGAKFNALERGDHNDWCYASLEDVKANFARVVGNDRLRTVKGPVQETLLDPANIPEKIAVLRLDTDFYDSTKIELEQLWPRLSPGGVLIIDDYGEWDGARKAVDEFFADAPLWLIRLSRPVRIAIKSH